MIVFATPGENMVYGLLKLAHPLFFECFFCASFCFCGFSCFSVLITASNQTYSMSYYSHRVNLHKSCCGCWLPRRIPVLTPHTLFGQPHSVAFVFSVCFSSLFVGVQRIVYDSYLLDISQSGEYTPRKAFNHETFFWTPLTSPISISSPYWFSHSF